MAVSAGISFNQLTSAPYITRAISRIRTPLQKLQTFFGMQIGGGNLQGVTGRYVGWDIFDKTRKIAKGRAPGTGPSTTAPNPQGHVNAVVLRAHEKIPLLLEKIFNTRPLGAQWGNSEVDLRGQKYITSQEEFLAQKFNNFREFAVSRMLRGQFYVVPSGEDWILTDTSTGAFSVNFQVPAGNKTTLNMLGTGAIIGTLWSNTAAPIHQQLLQINAAFEQQHGFPLKHIWCNSTVWYYVTKNTEFINLSGTANSVILDYAPVGDTTAFETTIRGVPWLKWHVYDGGLDIGTTTEPEPIQSPLTDATTYFGASTPFTKFLADSHAYFMPDPSPIWAEGLEGSEPVMENYMGGISIEQGFHAWTEPKTQPPQVELIALDNFVPALYVPYCLADGTIA